MNDYLLGRKSRMPIIIKAYFGVVIVLGSLCLFTTTDEVTTPTGTQHKQIRIKTKQEMEQILNDINIAAWVGGNNKSLQSGTFTSDGQKQSQSYTTIGDFILGAIDASKASNLELTRAREAVNIFNDVAQSSGAGKIKPWLLFGVQALEKGAPVKSKGGFVVPWAEFDQSGCSVKYGDMLNGKMVTYSSFSSDDMRQTGCSFDTRDYVGPFQLHRKLLNSTDIYKFNTGAYEAASHLAGVVNELNNMKFFDGCKFDNDDYMQGMLLAAYNAGSGNLDKEIPRDSRQDFVKFINTLYGDKDKMNKIGISVCNNGMASINSMIWDFANVPGIHLSQSAVNAAKSYNPSFTPVESVVPDSAGGGRFKAGNKFITNSASPNNRSFVIGQEQLRYILAAYPTGLMAWNSMNQVLSNADSQGKRPTNIGGISDEVTYFWKSMLSNGRSTIQLINDSEGTFGQIGFKGNYPIFIQGSGVNDISSIGWKYSGGATTLGTSGCSMFALMSLIHGIGYGNMPLPKTVHGTNGLNEHGEICFEELAKALPNGPVVADDVASLGYIVQTIPTDDEGLERLYRSLEQGVPYVVNVRYGEINGYDKNYQPHPVHFTNEGHFILLVGAFRHDGKRYVEVVQSTYSKGGTAIDDQNTLVYDFDELKDKKIIRSSGGSCVPAYTIVDRIDTHKTPLFINENYTGIVRQGIEKPQQEIKEINISEQQANVSINQLVQDFIQNGYISLPTDLYVDIDNKNKSVDIFITDTEFLRVTGINFYTDLKGSGYYKQGDYIGLVSDHTTFTRYQYDSSGEAKEVILK